MVARAPTTRLSRIAWSRLRCSACIHDYLLIVIAETKLLKARVEAAVECEGRRVVRPALAITPGVLLCVPIMQVRVRQAATLTMTMLETTSRKMPHVAARALTLHFRCRTRRVSFSSAARIDPDELHAATRARNSRLDVNTERPCALGLRCIGTRRPAHVA